MSTTNCQGQPPRPMPTDPESLMTPGQVAEMFGLSEPTTVYRLARTGRLTHVRLSDRVMRFRRADVLEYISTRAVPATRPTAPKGDQ